MNLNLIMAMTVKAINRQTYNSYNDAPTFNSLESGSFSYEILKINDFDFPFHESLNHETSRH